ncbi:MAG: class I SAM-dependent methyltransferase [Candidatus Sungiibacteriota bacterium]|uniref:Class I SAM-dependent methyltransferase n=1 Tax=Candidatus Sungiibacteriota bacterium TaxID=2750080 RepID=A0A7T5URH7_9BACT|nr:MAG: class I SAM-dependent methyltransferase [Candidatus Sungbacteria bacterium]
MEPVESDERTPNLKRYLEKLGIALGELYGKRILDIGAGGLYFAKEAWLAHEIKVFSVEPDLTESISRYYGLFAYATACCQTSPELEAFQITLRRTVRAFGQALPFKDESFDYVVSIFGVPFMIKNYFEGLLAINEGLRVLRHKGTLIFYPLESQFFDIKENTALKAEMLVLRKFPDFRIVLSPYDDPEAMRTLTRVIIKKG